MHIDDTDHRQSSSTPEAPSTGRLTACALAILNLNVVQRSTLRAMLPRGETKRRGPVSRERWHLGERKGAGKNKTSIAFGQALQEFERQGWVERTPEFVIVRDHQALLDYAFERQPAAGRDSLNVKGAIAAARNDLRKVRDTADHDEIEQRHDEIRALLYLLHAPAAGLPRGSQTLREAS
jgi:hypothetical protein